MREWPRILLKDGPGLRRFSDFLQHCYTAMHSIKYLEVLNDPEENQKMLRKLPNHLVSRWSRIVDKWIGEEREESQCRQALGPPEVNNMDNAREAKYLSFENENENGSKDRMQSHYLPAGNQRGRFERKRGQVETKQ